MASLADELREVLLKAGACPETASELAGDFEPKANNRIARDKRDLDAMQALFSKDVEDKPAACKCHRSTVYRRAERARRKSRFPQPSATTPG